jgi:hypothetical protein
MKIKIRIDQNLVPGNNYSYPGGAIQQLQLLGLKNITVPYTDEMPIYGDVTQVQFNSIKSQKWVTSVEVISE